MEHVYDTGRVHTVCSYMRKVRGENGPCKKCPYEYEDGSGPMCHSLAREIINIVETGNAWRKPSPPRRP